MNDWHVFGDHFQSNMFLYELQRKLILGKILSMDKWVLFIAIKPAFREWKMFKHLYCSIYICELNQWKLFQLYNFEFFCFSDQTVNRQWVTLRQEPQKAEGPRGVVVILQGPQLMKNLWKGGNCVKADGGAHSQPHPALPNRTSQLQVLAWNVRDAQQT